MSAEGNITVKEIEELNKRIEVWMKKRTSIEAERTVLHRNLTDAIAEYSKEYGKDLSGSSMKEMAANIENEYNAVSAEMSKEYSLASKVVALLDQGNVEEAQRLLDVSKGVKETVVDKEDEPASVEKKAEDPAPGGFAFEGASASVSKESKTEEAGGIIKKEEAPKVQAPEGVPVKKESINPASNFVPEDFGTAHNAGNDEVTGVKMSSAPKFGKLSFDDDDEDEGEDGFAFSEPVKEAPKQEKKKIEMPKGGLGNNFLFDDDDDDDFGDFGGGIRDLLSGTNFEV